MAESQTYEFKTDVKQLLDLVTHSLYSHKDIFLRELISNATDAIDKLRFESLTNPELLEGDSDWKIKLSRDDSAKTLTISDNGCGMTKENLLEHIGTIAKSGTKEFVEKLKNSKSESSIDLIGQFGVGFYSSFMVADEVVIRTRAPKGEGWEWKSKGDGNFELSKYAKLSRGTEIILHIKEDCQEFLSEATVRSTVQTYSNYVEFPIIMDVEKFEYPLDKEGKPDYSARPDKKMTTETLNSREAIWLKSKADVSQEDYNAFYKQITHDFTAPLETIHYSAEGATEYKALMYLPSQAPADLFSSTSAKGLHLYVNRVFIMNDCKELLPPYLRFVRGVIDSSDLPLNVSREILQNNPQLAKISKGLVGKILTTLSSMKENSRDKYESFYKQFRAVLKEGLHYDYSNKEKLMDLLLFETTKLPEGSYRSLKEYVDGMQKGQENIYYISSESRHKAMSAPQLEIFRSKEMEVLLMTDHVDEWIIPQLMEYDKKHFAPVNRGELDLEEDKEKKSEIKKKGEQYADLLSAIKSKLEEDVKEVRFSTRLTESACCLTSDADAVTPHMEQMLKSLGQEIPENKKILELNLGHPVVEMLNRLQKDNKGTQLFDEYVSLLYNQALLTEGSQLKNPLAFAKKVSELMVKAELAS